MTLVRRLLLPLLGLVLLAACAGSPDRAVPPPSPVPGAPSTTGSQPSGMGASEPTAVDIPKIGAHSSLIPLGLNPDHTIEVPPVRTPMQAGWYSYGPTPGEIGPAVILGHVDGNKQQGIFYRLDELAPGDQASVSRKDGSTARFTVTKVERIAKNSFPTQAVYGDTPDAELRLITCGGSFDRVAHSYLDSIIVYAVLS